MIRRNITLPGKTQTESLAQEEKKGFGRLYLLPSPLGPDSVNRVLPEHVVNIIHQLDTFFVERIRKASSFLKWLKHPLPDFECHFYELNQHTPTMDLLEMRSLLINGTSAGIISEAGCPAIADPGSDLVCLAHESNIPVTPLVGPSSIILALMSSGLNGQSFCFHGYLPKPGEKRKQKVQSLQKLSFHSNSTQIFMETPYRNNDLMNELIRELHDDTWLCVASNLTLNNESIITQKIMNWKKTSCDLDQLPSIFLLLASGKSR